MSQKSSHRESTQKFYDRIADVHNLALRVNGYRQSVEKFLRKLDLRVDENSVVLDAGCGTGIVTLGFQSAGFRPRHMISLDLSFNSLKVAREQFANDKKTDDGKIATVQGNVLSLPFADNSLDLILTCGVLEYVPLNDGLAELARVLKPGARLVFIPIKPSLVGSVLELLYKFKTHPLKSVKNVAQRYFDIVGNYKFPITEPIAWSKMVFLLEKKANAA
jgi:ubiquinone/menaquinone biosynthesis C-methylase UbiE